MMRLYKLRERLIIKVSGCNNWKSLYDVLGVYRRQIKGKIK